MNELIGSVPVHVKAYSWTSLESLLTKRPESGPFVIAMDAAWKPSWRGGCEAAVTVLEKEGKVTVFVWEPRKPPCFRANTLKVHPHAWEGRLKGMCRLLRGVV